MSILVKTNGTHFNEVGGKSECPDQAECAYYEYVRVML
jgi:hypothetical protein